jgi:cytosine/creatinine deaminase
MAVAPDAERVGPVDGPALLAGVELTALRNVRLLDGSLADLDLVAGEITAVRAADEKTDAGTDAGGWRLVHAAGEPHAHLDKALSAEQIEPGPLAGNDLVTAIEQWRSLVPTLTSDDFADRARRAVRRYVANGITTIRTHADALLAGDPLRGVDALLGLREELSGTVTLQVCLLAG